MDLDRCLALADQIGTSFHFGAFKVYRAQLDLMRGKPAIDDVRAEGALQEALALQQGRECWYDAAWTHISLAKLLLHQGRSNEAETALAEVRKAFTEMDVGTGIAALGEIART